MNTSTYKYDCICPECGVSWESIYHQNSLTLQEQKCSECLFKANFLRCGYGTVKSMIPNTWVIN